MLKTRQRTIAIVLTLLSVVMSASGQVVRKNTTVPPFSLHEIRMPVGDPVVFVPLQPLDLKWLEYKLADGSYVCVIPTGPPGGVIFVDAWQNGSPGEIPVHLRTKIIVEGEAPEPEPDPDTPDPPIPPPLSPWAKLSYDTIPLINKRSQGLAPIVGANFQSTASAIRAGVIKTKSAAITDLHNRNQRVWGEFGEADWWPWLNRIGKAVDKAEDSGQLDDLKLYSQLLYTLGKGLKYEP